VPSMMIASKDYSSSTMHWRSGRKTAKKAKQLRMHQNAIQSLPKKPTSSPLGTSINPSQLPLASPRSLVNLSFLRCTFEAVPSLIKWAPSS
jgi:hypothetical protein